MLAWASLDEPVHPASDEVRLGAQLIDGALDALPYFSELTSCHVACDVACYVASGNLSAMVVAFLIIQRRFTGSIATSGLR